MRFKFKMKTSDVFYYSGAIRRIADKGFIDHVLKKRRSQGDKAPSSASLVLVTEGGDPNAAYKISRCLQENYEHFTVIIPTICKSAGTLIAVGAEELVFGPYGELGPLDVQISKPDDIGKLDSGLNMNEAFRTIENRAINMFSKMFRHITSISSGGVTFQTASNIASGFSSSLYGEVLKKVDPEEVGSRSRAMRIGEDYCKRLNGKFRNLDEDELTTLSRTYPSHGFVIDKEEASNYFKKVRGYSEEENLLIGRIPREYFWQPREWPLFGDIPNQGKKTKVPDSASSPSPK